MNNTITIFGSAVPVENDAQYKFAYELGAALTKAGFNICSGGNKGIMEAVSKGAFDNDGKIYGVTVDLWDVKPNPYITVEVKEKKLFDRIAKLIELGDAYVILQGGTGTLLEFAAVWEYANKNLQKQKPIVCHSKMWKTVSDVINEQLKSENRNTDLVKYCSSVTEIVEYLIKTV
ncbi:MAG: LOG family protein [Ignavibacteriota bacterium]|nr:LOG family protein [Ignavibacteriota bacterium]MBW7843298.1 LOG family protein [Ignavibacterium sp.]MCO6447646.1 LOG family protein [Ignavibacterium album]MCZ2267394.1 LOG family protein [Ignavibacteriales bacterium]HOJ06221.1 LOG family protein [Ignavibacteriaceae bacterium]